MAYLAAGAVQRVLGCARGTLLRLVHSGLLPCRTDARGWRWFDEADVYRVAFDRQPKSPELQKMLTADAEESEPAAVAAEAEDVAR